MLCRVYRGNVNRLFQRASRLCAFYSTESTPSVVGKQDKALEVIEEEGKVVCVALLSFLSAYFV